MKIQELRDVLKLRSREELEVIVAELYKSVPKNKIEDNQIDEFINSPQKKDNQKKVKAKARPILDIQKEINVFSENAKNQYYLGPNRIVPKSERSKWRFLVKNLYKEVLVSQKEGNSTKECAVSLQTLYETLTYACYYQIFTAYDSFESVGITQVDFFNQVLKLYRESVEIDEFIDISIHLIINNSLNRYTLHSELMDVFFSYCSNNSTLDKVIIKTKEILETVKSEPDKKRSFFSSDFRTSSGLSYQKVEKINNLSEIVLRANCMLHNYKDGIAFFRSNSIERDLEVTLYVLVRILLDYNNPEVILAEINKSMDVKPRESLLKLRDFITKHHALPEKHYF